MWAVLQIRVPCRVLFFFLGAAPCLGLKTRTLIWRTTHMDMV